MAFIETAGINGIINDQSGFTDVFLWGGGTLQQAIANTAPIVIKHNGSGYLANGNISWDKLGNLLMSGYLESNNSGNKIVINPTSRTIQLIAPDKGILGLWSFFNNGSIISLFFKPSTAQTDETQINGNNVGFSRRTTNTYYYSRVGIGGAKFDIKLFPTKSLLAQLEVGELYRDGDVIKMKIQ